MLVMHAYDQVKSQSPVPVLFAVGFSKDPQELLPDANGAVTFHSDNRGSRDGWAPGKRSWTKDRYGYLLRLDDSPGP